MNKNSLLGILLLVTGLFIIVFALSSTYMLFTQNTPVPSFFNLPGVSLDLTNLVGSDMPSDQIAQMRNSKSLKTDLIAPEIINAPLNYFVYLLFMGFFVTAGARVAGLGIQFLRPIKVNLKEEKDVTDMKKEVPVK